MGAFDFDNCTIDDILRFAKKNYLDNKDEIDAKKKSLDEQINESVQKEPEFHEGQCEINC